MSLLSFLEQKDVRDRFNETFTKPKLTPTPTLLAPPLTKNYALVGRAFDYLLRFRIKALNPHAIERGWVAQNALHFLKCNAQTRLYEQAYLIITEATEHYTDFLQTQKVTDTLLRSALRLAKIETICRTKKIDPNLDQIDDEDIVDLKALFAIVNVEQFTSPEPILLNPTFDLASQVVGGADADLVLGDALIDVKTVKEFSLERRDFNQLIGYYVLSQLAGIDNAPPGHELKRLGIYFSRYAYLLTFNVSDVIDPITFPSFLDWFKRRCDPSGLLEP